MSYQAKLDGALALIQKHNEVIGTTENKPNPGFVDPQEFQTLLKAAGYHEESHLSGMGHEEILDLLPAYKGIKPKVLAKEIAKIFRDKAEIPVESSSKHISEKKAANMKLNELVSRLDVEEPTSPVAKRLKEITKNQPFIVFTTGRNIDVETTLGLVNAIRSGHPAVEITYVNNEPKKVYVLGDLPENYADENPLFHDRPLRPDGSCDQTGRSYTGIPLSVKQMIYLAVEDGVIDVTQKNGIMIAHDVINMAIATDAEKRLRQIYAKVALKFDELSKTGNLPTLKIALGGKAVSENARPFPEGRKVVWATPPANANYYPEIGNGYYVDTNVGKWLADNYMKYGQIKKW